MNCYVCLSYIKSLIKLFSNFMFRRCEPCGHQRPVVVTKFTWWRHEMEYFPRYWSFVRGIHWLVTREFLAHKGQWRWALVFSLICVWTSSWTNSENAGDLRRHRTQYDVIVVMLELVSQKEVAKAGTSNYIPQVMCHVIDCPWPWYLFGHICLIQYIPRNMHTVLLWFALLWLCNRS